MMSEIKAALHRSHDTLLQDAAGAVSLMVILLGCLHLPGFF